MSIRLLRISGCIDYLVVYFIMVKLFIFSFLIYHTIFNINLQYYKIISMYEGLVNENPRYKYKEQDPQYMGEPFDPQLASGPTEQRKCRDVLCLLLYILFWGGLIAVAVVAFSQGHPHLLAAPFDSSGLQCGYSPGYESFPYAYFNISNTSMFACINQCPDPGLNATSKCILNTNITNCEGFGSYSTIQFVGVCYPSNDAIAQTINLGIGFFDESIADLKATWPISLAIIFMTLILSLMLLFFIRACGGCLVITTIVLYFAVIITFGVICLLTAEGKINIVVVSAIQDMSVLRGIAIVAFIIAGISFLVLLCSIRKIRIGIMVIKTTAMFTQQQCQTILVPVFMFISIALFISFWITVSIFIFSSGTVGQCHGSPYACIDWNVGVKRSLAFYFIGLFWNCQVAIGMCQFVIASTTAYWYFSHLNGTQLSSPVCKSFCRAMSYHLGSIAFGALILCILVVLQLVFEVMHWLGKQKSMSNNPVSHACQKCCIDYIRCCLACFERFIRFISHNAFIMMAITGSGFCQAAHEAFYLVIRSAAAYAITHGVGHLLMFFGKLLITAICTFVGYIMITQIEQFSTQIFTPVMPTIMFFVISYVISSLFMDVFGIGSDTLLLCYCLERDIHRGSAKSCPPHLQEVLDSQ